MADSEVSRSTVAEDIEIVGSIKCASNIQLDGKLNGDLSCNGNAVIGSNAVIKGNISVESVTIMGQVNGNVAARDRIELKSTARLNGDIRAKRLTVEDGVTFVGKSEVNPSGAAAGRGPVGAEGKREGAQVAEAEPAADGEPTEEKPKGGVFGRK